MFYLWDGLFPTHHYSQPSTAITDASFGGLLLMLWLIHKIIFNGLLWKGFGNHEAVWVGAQWYSISDQSSSSCPKATQCWHSWAVSMPQREQIWERGKSAVLQQLGERSKRCERTALQAPGSGLKLVPLYNNLSFYHMHINVDKETVM